MPPLNSDWPRWTIDTKGKKRVHIEVAMSVDALVQTLYSQASAFAVSSQVARGNKEYRETAWVASDAALQSVDTELVTEAAIPAAPLPQTGAVRRVGFSAAGMGIKYKTEELQRITEATPGQTYVIEGCVFTTATYGDTFRPLTRTRITAAEGGDASELVVESSLVYISAVNKFVRSCIERGADSGMSKNFMAWTELLSKVVPLVDLTKDAVKRSATKAPLKVVLPEYHSSGDVPRQQNLWGGILDARLATHLEPIAAWIRALIPGVARDEGARGGGLPSGEAQAAAAVLLVAAVHLVLRCLSAVVQRVCHLPGVAGRFSRHVVSYSLLPTTVGSALAAFVLVGCLQSALASATGLVPDIVQAIRDRRQSGCSSVQSAAATATVASPEEAPSKGVRFEGYDDAFLESMATAVPDLSPSASNLSITMQGYAGVMRGMWHDSVNAIMSPRAAAAAAVGVGVARREQPSGGLSQQLRATGASVQGESGSSSPRSGSSPQDKGSASSALPVPAPLPVDEGSQGPRLEEVFENERMQPFRGWGHTWPGHFLPTDRVGHWSSKAGGPGGRPSMSFTAVAPHLRPGNEWDEEEWHVDFSGHGASAVDAEGWAYAVDFSWLLWPPTPGSGRKKVTDFVRRRRWIRMQSPVAASDTTDRDSSIGNGEAAAASPDSVDSTEQQLASSPPRRQPKLLEALAYPPLAGDALSRLSHSPMKLSRGRSEPHQPHLPHPPPAAASVSGLPPGHAVVAVARAASGVPSAFLSSSPSGGQPSNIKASVPLLGKDDDEASGVRATIVVPAYTCGPEGDSDCRSLPATAQDAAHREGLAVSPTQSHPDAAADVAAGKGGNGGSIGASNDSTASLPKELPPTPEKMLAIEEAEAAAAAAAAQSWKSNTQHYRSQSVDSGAPATTGSPAPRGLAADSGSSFRRHLFAAAVAAASPKSLSSERSPGGQDAAALAAAMPSTLPPSTNLSSSPPSSAAAAAKGFRNNLSSWLAKGEAAVASAANGVRGSASGSLAGSSATSPTVGAAVLPGANLTPDQAAAAARLLMGGNSLRGMPDVPFAISRTTSSVAVLGQLALSSGDSGHLASADSGHLSPAGTHVATGNPFDVGLVTSSPAAQQQRQQQQARGDQQKQEAEACRPQATGSCSQVEAVEVPTGAETTDSPVNEDTRHSEEGERSTTAAASQPIQSITDAAVAAADAVAATATEGAAAGAAGSAAAAAAAGLDAEQCADDVREPIQLSDWDSMSKVQLLEELPLMEPRHDPDGWQLPSRSPGLQDEEYILADIIASADQAPTHAEDVMGRKAFAAAEQMLCAEDEPSSLQSEP